MSDSKKTKKSAPETTPFAEVVFSALVDVADDSRAEVHKQAASLLAFASGVADGGFAWLGKLNDRVDHLAVAGLKRIDAAGSDFLAQTRALPQKVGDTARDAAERAVDSAKVLTASPRKKAA